LWWLNSSHPMGTRWHSWRNRFFSIDDALVFCWRCGSTWPAVSARCFKIDGKLESHYDEPRLLCRYVTSFDKWHNARRAWQTAWWSRTPKRGWLRKKCKIGAAVSYDRWRQRYCLSITIAWRRLSIIKWYRWGFGSKPKFYSAKKSRKHEDQKPKFMCEKNKTWYHCSRFSALRLC